MLSCPYGLAALMGSRALNPDCTNLRIHLSPKLGGLVNDSETGRTASSGPVAAFVANPPQATIRRVLSDSVSRMAAPDRSRGSCAARTRHASAACTILVCTAKAPSTPLRPLRLRQERPTGAGARAEFGYREDRRAPRRPRFLSDGGCPARIRTSINGVRVRCLTIRRRGNAERRSR